MKIDKESIIAFAKKYKYIIASVSALLLVLIIVITALASGGDKGEGSEAELDWGEGITEGIPEFDGELASKSCGEGYAAFYYKNVTGEQVGDYTALIENECGTEFSSDRYPRSAKYGEKTVVIHYNVTEMKMSVTVTSPDSESQEIGNEDQ
ncbi:MAG: hypothetical protein J6R45_01660 [Clostridia bacterium]|nr:hypothetical protein [Clostridia bacterium]